MQIKDLEISLRFGEVVFDQNEPKEVQVRALLEATLFTVKKQLELDLLGISAETVNAKLAEE